MSENEKNPVFPKMSYFDNKAKLYSLLLTVRNQKIFTFKSWKKKNILLKDIKPIIIIAGD